jgi:oligopeptidase A
MNPLLDFSALPAFDRITPADIAPAIESLLQDCEAALATVLQADFPADWLQLSKTLDVAVEKLGIAWGAVGHLNAVADTPALRAAYTAQLPIVTEFFTRMGADERLYAKYKAINPASLNAEQSKALANSLRGFVLGGAELQGEAKARFAAIQERQADLAQTFSEHVLDATDAWFLYTTQDAATGLPADVLQAAAELAQADAGKDGAAVDANSIKLTLKMPCYLPVMQFAQSSALREQLYRAYVSRASELGQKPEWDNSAVMDEILALRAEEAQLLGYANFAALSLVPKMADTPAQVMHFLRDLAARARPYAQKDVADLRAFAAQELGIHDPQAWDWPYISEKLKEARYAFSEQEVRQYFPAPRVLAGLFGIVQKLFGVQIEADTAPVWNDAVEFFRISKNGAQGKQLIGQFYLDQPARTGKRGGAWMDDVRSRWLRPDTGALQTPVAQLVCNFPAGVGGKPALLTHDDITTLFHEFGHGLHHLLTQVNEHDVAGISGVEWDAVELPSQFMENFCWEWEVLQDMSAHVDTGASLPRALFDKMLAAKNFQSGMQTLRQVEFSLFDMQLHSASKVSVMATLHAVRDEVAVLPAPAFNRSAHSFSHIFAGGYAAGYYSYKWAELLSADAYAAFEEDAACPPAQNAAVGQRYLEEILQKGGSRSAAENFAAFRGRAPQIDALLRHQGMGQAVQI